MTRTLRIGARGSRLSLWQAHHAIDALTRHGVPTELRVLSSSGDRDQTSAIEDLPGDVPFADDLEQALRAREIDVAVHSLKDLAPVASDDLIVAALLPRGTVTESLVARNGASFAALQAGAVIGTSSSRRRAQIRLLRPDLVCRTIRGPVDARVDQVLKGAFDGAILATAGLERLGLQREIAETFSPGAFVPAAGQGALALQVRSTDHGARRLLAPLDHFATRVATTAELIAQSRLEAAGLVGGAFARVEHVFITLHVRALPREAAWHADGMASGTDPGRIAEEAADRALERCAVAG